MEAILRTGLFEDFEESISGFRRGEDRAVAEATEVDGVDIP